ncbi:DUF4189 domain-containing protein [Pseudomonas viridiflava]|uniref:DUF4189 domain-containing protein n=1 Tax=Pseudomonas viridiflava TaxID=33069 RepID=UPI001C317829|nr:DUF4189 domain-containing protein [Pseudomonas viridiflava]QXG50027.1 DUF4189 domain-containing protein [Pseudomonas viridiflava]
MLRSMLFSLLLVTASQSVIAQTACPAGVAPGSPQCGPDSGTSRAEPAPPRMTGEWIKTWGAIGNSKNTSQAWAAVGQMSKSDAEKDAIDQCQSAGFQECYVTFTYMNQCVAMATPVSGGSKSHISSAADIPLASRNALERCRDNAGVECSVIYSDCTEPVFRKY